MGTIRTKQLHVLLLCHVVRVRFPGATAQPAGILDCLQGRIRNQAVCSLRPVFFPVKTFLPRGKQCMLRGQEFSTITADTEHPESWMLAAAKPQPWRPNMG